MTMLSVNFCDHQGRQEFAELLGKRTGQTIRSLQQRINNFVGNHADMPPHAVPTTIHQHHVEVAIATNNVVQFHLN